MIFEAKSLALADSGVKCDELDDVVLATSDLVDDISISSMVRATETGAI